MSEPAGRTPVPVIEDDPSDPDIATALVESRVEQDACVTFQEIDALIRSA